MPDDPTPNARLRDQESGTTGVEDEEDNGLDAD